MAPKAEKKQKWDWTSGYVRGRDREDKEGNILPGAVLPCLANVILVLSHHPAWKGLLAYDEFVSDIVTTREPPFLGDLFDPSRIKGSWDEQDTTRAATWLARECGLVVKSHVVGEALWVVAMQRRVHPLRAELEALKWDGKKRLDDILIRNGGAEDSLYTRQVTSKWMISAVARVMQPGCQADSVLVLEGNQGFGKTSFLRCLAGSPERMLETSAEIGTKDSYQILLRKWIVEFGELDSFGRSELSRVKQFITERSSTYRPSYAKKARDFLRQCIFAASTNDYEYLKDNTGARRFWPVRIYRAFDLKALSREVPQLWAEAVVRYKAKEAWHLSDANVLKEHQEVAEERRQVDPWEHRFVEWINAKGNIKYRSEGLSTYKLLTLVFERDPYGMTRSDEMRAASVLRACGWSLGKRSNINGKRERLYYPNEGPKLQKQDGPDGLVGHSSNGKKALSPTVQPVQPILRIIRNKKSRLLDRSEN